MKTELKDIAKQVEQFKAEGKKIFATSSFQSQSIPLLHLISQIDNSIPIYFTNTGFLFPETLKFKDELVERFSLNVKELFSETPKSHQLDDEGRLLFTSDPDYCESLQRLPQLLPLPQF